MEKYKFTIEVVRGDEHIICIYVPECPHMFEALKTAQSFAGFQLDEERADYIKRVEVVKLEVEDEEDA